MKLTTDQVLRLAITAVTMSENKAKTEQPWLKHDHETVASALEHMGGELSDSAEMNHRLMQVVLNLMRKLGKEGMTLTAEDLQAKAGESLKVTSNMKERHVSLEIIKQQEGQA